MDQHKIAPGSGAEHGCPPSSHIGARALLGTCGIQVIGSAVLLTLERLEQARVTYSTSGTRAACPRFRVSGSLQVWGWGVRICIPDKFPDYADLLAWEHTLRSTELDLQTELSPEVPPSNRGLWREQVLLHPDLPHCFHQCRLQISKQITPC